jgi:hypothetical protein
MGKGESFKTIDITKAQNVYYTDRLKIVENKNCRDEDFKDGAILG